MKSSHILVVTGFPRCGSSLLMRMLHVGGFPCVYDHDMSYECDAMLSTPIDAVWARSCVGKAVKVLDPVYFPMPRGLPYVFILLTRNSREQAKSQLKLLELLGGLVPTRGALRDLERSLNRDLPRVRTLLQSYLDSHVHEMTFESILADPTQTAARLSQILGELSEHRMAECVVARSARCYPGMMEAERLRTQLS